MFADRLKGVVLSSIKTGCMAAIKRHCVCSVLPCAMGWIQHQMGTEQIWISDTKIVDSDTSSSGSLNVPLCFQYSSTCTFILDSATQWLVRGDAKKSERWTRCSQLHQIENGDRRSVQWRLAFTPDYMLVFPLHGALLRLFVNSGRPIYLLVASQVFDETQALLFCLLG